MHEPYHTPTTSPANPPHGHSHPRHSRTFPRHSREGGNPSPCDHTPGSSALLPPATEFDKIRQNATKCNETSCAHAHARDDHETTLSLKQIEFLRHLPTERTISAAAEKAGVYRTTFYNWIKDPAFKAEYEHCRSLALTIAKTEISALSLDAAELLHECLKPGYHPAVRVHAAGTILRNAQRLTQATNQPAPHPPTSFPLSTSFPRRRESPPANQTASSNPQSSINNRQSAINNPSHVIPAKAGTHDSPRDEPNEPPESRGPHSLNAVVW